MKDVYGADFDLDMSTDYSAKVDTFQEAIEKIRNEGILCSYRDNKRNFIFDLAQEIVENSSACRLYLQAKYFKYISMNIKIATNQCINSLCIYVMN